MEEVFTYTGRYPDSRGNFTHVKFDRSVRVLKPDTFSNCREIKKVELNEGLVIIGEKVCIIFAPALANSLEQTLNILLLAGIRGLPIP